MSRVSRTAARTEQVIRAAKKVFAAKGFQESTMSEIAREAGLSEPTIYEYFSSKEEILFAIPGRTALRGAEIYSTYLPMIKGAANKLRFVIHTIVSILETDPEYAAVSFLILKQNRKFTETESYRALRKNYRVMNQTIEEGIASGEFRPDTDTFFIRSMILGTIEHLTIRKLLYNTQDNLLDYVDTIMDAVLRVVENQPEWPSFRVKLTVEPEPAVKSAPGPARKKVKTPAKK